MKHLYWQKDKFALRQTEAGRRAKTLSSTLDWNVQHHTQNERDGPKVRNMSETDDSKTTEVALPLFLLKNKNQELYYSGHRRRDIWGEMKVERQGGSSLGRLSFAIWMVRVPEPESLPSVRDPHTKYRLEFISTRGPKLVQVVWCFPLFISSSPLEAGDYTTEPYNGSYVY